MSDEHLVLTLPEAMPWAFVPVTFWGVATAYSIQTYPDLLAVGEGAHRMSEVAKYRKKPVVIDAIRWDGANWNQVCDFLGVPENGRGVWLQDGEVGDGWLKSGDEQGVLIHTMEGEMLARQGDWIIRGVKGEFYPCKPDIFDATYETPR